MYGKNKGSVVPSDAQSKEKLAVYVYEYLVHVGAQKTASSFLQEIRWDKPINVGEPPGFLHSWWNVFWDLYSAAPERRDTHEHSSEAKVFYDYGFVSSGYPNGISHPTHPVMSAPGGVGGPGMPPPLGPPGPDPSMRQRPSGPSMMPGAAGLPPGAAPGPHHPSLRFHQTGAAAAGAYSGLPVTGGLIPPPHANLIPGGAGPPVHPIHGGPMLAHHHHPPPGAMLGHTRPRWMGPSVQPQQPGGPSQTSGGPPVVCSGSNSNSSTGPGSIGPGSCGGGGSGGGIVPSPGHPGTPTQHAPPAPTQQQSQHLAVPSPLNNQPSDHQSVGNLPPGHPSHHTAGHYMVGQPPQQQTPPASSSSACLPPEYSTRPSPHLVFNAGSSSGGPGSTPDSGMYSGNEASLLNGAGSTGSTSSNSGGVGGCSGGPPSRGSGSSTSGGMLPPPPPDYSAGGGMPAGASGYPGGDMKASPLHSGGGTMGSADLMGLSGGPQLLPPDYPPGGNGAGGSFCPAGGPGAPPESVMMMPPPLPTHQQHMANVTTCQNAPPPPQYVSSSGPHSVSSSATVSAPPSSLQSIASGVSNPSPAGGPGSVQFPQEYSFSQLS